MFLGEIMISLYIWYYIYITFCIPPFINKWKISKYETLSFYSIWTMIFIDRLWSKIEEETEKLKIDWWRVRAVLMIVLLTEPNVAITPQSRQYWQISGTGHTALSSPAELVIIVRERRSNQIL